MLETTKTTNLNGVIKIDGETVLYISATINSDNGLGANITKSIYNQDLYMANKESVRADVKKFEEEVYKIEDDSQLETLTLE